MTLEQEYFERVAKKVWRCLSCGKFIKPKDSYVHKRVYFNIYLYYRDYRYCHECGTNKMWIEELKK